MFSYDTATNVGKVRLLIPDNREADFVFQDHELEALLSLEGENVWRAAALGLETIAADQALTLKYTQVQDVIVDGTRAAAQLLKRAEGLRARAQEGDPSATSTDTGFAIVQQARTQDQIDGILRNYDLTGGA